METKCLNYDDPILGEQRPIHVTQEGATELAARLISLANAFTTPQNATVEEAPKKTKKGAA